jgi:transcriptional regulator with XRE-family HTH domain
MELGQRLAHLRAEQHLSQGDIEKRTGLLRCYLSRVENGYTVPSLSTLEKLASAFELPLYRLFYDGPKPNIPALIRNGSREEPAADNAEMKQLRKLLPKIKARDRSILLRTAKDMAGRAK